MVLKTSIPTYMIGLTVFNLIYLIMKPSGFWDSEIKVWQKCIVVFFYLAELALYVLYIAHLITRRQMRVEVDLINKRLDQMNAGHESNNLDNEQ